jgi:hypothetical protein
MKKYACFLSIVIFLGCQNKTKKINEHEQMILKSYCDSLLIKDSLLTANYKSEKEVNRKLKDSLFKQNWKIIKAKHYIKIVERNPHNIVFLVGWLKNQCFN